MGSTIGLRPCECESIPRDSMWDCGDDSGLRDARTQTFVDGVHWSGPGFQLDAAFQEEVCSGKSHLLLSPQICFPDYKDPFQRSISDDAYENALSSDEIEYPCEFVSPDKARILLQPPPRPAHFEVEVQRIGRFWSRLGVQLIVTEQDEVRVELVRERGLIPEWNAAHGSCLQIVPGDCITHVDGVALQAKELHDALQNPVMGGTLHLSVVTTPHQVVVHRRGVCRSPPESTASGDSSLPPSRTSSLGN